MGLYKCWVCFGEMIVWLCVVFVDCSLGVDDDLFLIDLILVECVCLVEIICCFVLGDVVVYGYCWVYFWYFWGMCLYLICVFDGILWVVVLVGVDCFEC